MRRGLPFLLILTFLLGPLAAALQTEDDSRLPACCRRHGEHHCAMGGGGAAALQAAAGSTPVFAAPAKCPFFPRAIASLSQTQAAENRAAAMATVQSEQPYVPAPIDEVIPAAVHSPHTGRAPPRVNTSATLV